MHIFLLREITREIDDTAVRKEDERDKDVAFKIFYTFKLAILNLI